MPSLRAVVACTLSLACLTCVEDATRSGPTGPRTATLAPPGAVLVGAGDIARCDGQGDEATATLLDAIDGTVFTAGNNVYGSSTEIPDFTNCYDPSWGRHKARTRPAVGSHEYFSNGAATYWQYFGAAAGDSGNGYYSYELGSWHVVVLNSSIDMRVGSPQEQWLRADLAAHPALCTLAYWHHPRFSSVPNSAGVTALPQIKPLWDALYAVGVEVVINGHYQVYERFAPQTPDGAADPPRGIRQFTVGTGGMDVQRFPLAARPNSEVRNSGAAGVLKLTLSDGGYTWEFIPVPGETFTDSGSGSCHDTSPPTPVSSVDVAPASPSLEVGARIRLTAVARDASGAPVGERVTTWSSSDPSVVKVNARGVVTAWAPGTATITATVEGRQGTAAIAATPSTAAILVGAGDIATCRGPYDELTAELLDEIPGTVFTVGDNVYDNGTPTEFAECYEPSWGRHKARTRPTLGNHDYYTPDAAGYFGYFGAAAGDPALGYYSYDLGTWHIVVLNNYQTMAPGSTQEQWLRADLAAHPARCTLAMWHEPLFSSGTTHGGKLATQPLWQALYDAGADVVVTGHDHSYQRFAPLTATGAVDPDFGMREFVVGTGGAGLEEMGPPVANTELRNNSAHGVLKLTLRDMSYEWEFIADPGQTFNDAGSAPCHGPKNNQPPQAQPGGPYRSEDVVAFDGSASSDPEGDTPLSYAWNFGDGVSASGVAPTHAYAADGIYTVTLVVTDARGTASAPATTTATIGNIPPSVSAGSDARMRPGIYTLRATFSDPGANDAPWRYTISWGDGFSQSGSTSSQSDAITASHPFIVPDTYRVRVTVTDKDGGVGTGEVRVTVTLTP